MDSIEKIISSIGMHLGDKEKLNPLSRTSIVINLSVVNLNPPTLQLIDKGFNLSLSPKHIPMEDIIFSIGSITHQLLEHEVEKIRKECG
jgi:hypothetical protein